MGMHSTAAPIITGRSSRISSSATGRSEWVTLTVPSTNSRLNTFDPIALPMRDVAATLQRGDHRRDDLGRRRADGEHRQADHEFGDADRQGDVLGSAHHELGADGHADDADAEQARSAACRPASRGPRSSVGGRCSGLRIVARGTSLGDDHRHHEGDQPDQQDRTVARVDRPVGGEAKVTIDATTITGSSTRWVRRATGIDPNAATMPTTSRMFAMFEPTTLPSARPGIAGVDGSPHHGEFGGAGAGGHDREAHDEGRQTGAESDGRGARHDRRRRSRRGRADHRGG